MLTSDEDCNFVPMPTLLDSDILKLNDFILVKFPQKKTLDIHYIGRICAGAGQQEFDVKFLRKNGRTFVFPLIDDISLEAREDIILKLSQPAVCQGTTRTAARFSFDLNLNLYNVR